MLNLHKRKQATMTPEGDDPKKKPEIEKDDKGRYPSDASLHGDSTIKAPPPPPKKDDEKEDEEKED